jgi:hypothetical protein
LVQQQPRLPELANRDDWLIASDPGPRLDHLSERERESLATHWAKLGQMEHASIAAFARFTLQLLSLGAPPELVDESTRALADETAHARLCFSIASAYAGSPIGPGPLHVDGSLVTTSLADLVDLVIAEGCVGETRAAVEALDAADVATDPAIRAAYLRIAADEQRHAQLAFRFLRFALERNPSTVRERLAVACDALSNDQVARQVTLPCLQALQRQRLPIGVPHVPVAIAT